MSTKNLNRITTRFDSASETRCKFVDRAEFMRLLLGNTRLERSDDRAAHIRGLFDPAHRCRFLIEEEKLFGTGKR